MSQAITMRHVTKRFGSITAVDAIDLDVARGEVFGLVGPNGAGKTTLLQILAALLAPSSGSIAVLGYDIGQDAEALRQRMGYVSQAFTLYGALSVEENVDFFADLYGVPAAVCDQRKETLLAWSRLLPFRKRRAIHLSGGMQKKLHLCCTLIHEPDLLLLDEPTTGVDPVSRRELWSILYDLVGRGLTLVVTTPYMDEADRCHRVAFMHQGRILHCDRPEALRREAHEVAWEMSIPEPMRVQHLLRQAKSPIRTHLIGDHLHALAPEGVEVADEIARVLAAPQPGELHLQQAPLSMEDVFVSMVMQTIDVSQRRVWRPSRPSAERVGALVDDVAVQVEDLTRVFGDFVAVRGLSLCVNRGEVFGFLGPNGSGKTTTIKMLCGLLPPSSGQGEVLGHDVRRQGRRMKARLGYMSQRFSLYHDLTVKENLVFFGQGYGLSPQRLTDRMSWVMEMAELGGEEGRLAGELSGGVKQRLALACAILHDPDLLFLDEPTSGVDPWSRHAFWELIGHLADEGMTVFVTTHYMDEAENCHRLALMHQGQLVAVGSPKTLKDNMRSGVMLELECSSPFAALQHLRRQASLSRASLFGRHLHVWADDPAAASPLIHATLEAAGLEVERLEPIPFSLEDVFIALTDIDAPHRRDTHA